MAALDFPSNPTPGQSFTVEGAVYVWNGYAWTGGLSVNVATPGVTGLMPGTDKTKLDGIASGATQNASNAFLLSRTNHTGTQLAATISDLTPAVNAIVGSGGGGSGGMSDAQLLARANHTGTQVAATISDFAAAAIAAVGSGGGGGGGSVAGITVVTNYTELVAAAGKTAFIANVITVPGAVTLTSDLMFLRGGALSASAGVTINGQVHAPPTQAIFQGNGPFILGPGTIDLHPGWWGAGTDATTNSSPAVQACFSAAAGRNKRVILSNMYRLDTAIQITAGGALEIAGIGMSNSGFMVNNSTGGFFYTSPKSGGVSPYLVDQVHVHDFCVIAKNGGTRGTALYFAWPVGTDVQPTLNVKNISIRCENDLANQARFGTGLQVRQANMCHIENFHGVHIDDTSCTMIRCDNASGEGQYGLHILRPNIQGCYCAISVTGWFEEVVIEPYGLDTQVMCIILDASGTNIPGGHNGVATIRGGDLNASMQTIMVKGWRWVNIGGLDAGIFASSPVPADVIYIENCLHTRVSDCSIGTGPQAATYGGIRMRDVAGGIVTGCNFHSSVRNGVLIEQPGLGDGAVPGVSVVGNTFAGGDPFDGTNGTHQTAIGIGTGRCNLIASNNIFGWRNSMYAGGAANSAFVTGNISLGCTNGANGTGVYGTNNIEM